MKRLFLLILIAFSGVANFKAKAQPTLTAANTNVVIGEQFISNEFSFNAAQFNSSLTSGLNQTWNFSNLTSVFFPPINVYFQPNHLPLGPNPYPAANVVTGCDDEYEYLKVNADSVVMVGYYNHFTEETVDYSNSVKKNQYPFTYNNSFTDNFAGIGDGMGPPVPLTGNIKVTADGYGTLILPNGTVANVLRVKSLKVTTTSLPNLTALDTITNLDWYLPGVHVPILRLSKQQFFAPNYSATYYQGYYINPFALSIKEETAANINLQLFPNPATSELTIQYQTQKPVKITLQNLVGKQIAELPAGKGSSGLQRLKVDVSNYPKGVYVLRLETEGQAVYKKLILQ